jgi:hypothetical protein
LTHPRCWNSTSRLKSAREEGAGLGQITRAYNSDGSIRFDALAELRSKHRLALSELTWHNVYTRPDLQIRAVVLKMGDNYKQFAPVASNHLEAYAFADAAYNGGIGGVNKERRACTLIAGCDPSKWFGHVEKYCMKSKVALYGQRSACDINRHHVTDVLLTRSPKYRLLYLQF